MLTSALAFAFGLSVAAASLVEKQYEDGPEMSQHNVTLPRPSAMPLRILALGDSITFGFLEESGNSYRRDVQCALHAHGFPTAMVGSVRNGNWEDNASDGFILHTIAEIQHASTPEIIGVSGPVPNVVLLHAGTVDFYLGEHIATAPQRLKTLITDVCVRLPDALVVVSQLIVNANATIERGIRGFNQQIPAIVDEVRKEGNLRVVMTSMSNVPVSDLLSDGTHPNFEGYSKMASNWLRSILAAYKGNLLVPAAGNFEDFGESSVRADGRCAKAA